jgi:hypothetical protein
MKLRHTAAFVFVGWYLLMPTSLKTTPKGNIWGPQKRLTFDTHEQCNSYKQNLIIAMQRAQFPLTGFVVSKCIQFEDRIAD